MSNMEQRDDPDWEILMSLFDHTCLRCHSRAVTIHEIEPKSHGRERAMQFENRIAICASCHNLVHRYNTQETRENLHRLRKEYIDRHAFR